MIRYIETHDLHAHPDRLDIFELCVDAIVRAIEKHDVDFVITSDLHDKNFYLSHEYNRFRAQVRRIIDTGACLVAISGTPGHETPAMYSPLEDIGLTLLRPKKTYGYYRSANRRIIYLAEHNDDGANCILFGIPELLLSQVVEQLGYPTHADYIAEYVAPMRLQFNDVPAILAIHGTISDCHRENEIDPKKKSSEVHLYSDDFAIANLTRISAGHIHTPTEFRGGGYSGSYGKTWNETVFVPGMNLVTISSADTREDLPELLVPSITRIPYGTPKRIKISKPLATYDPAIAYWLETDDPDYAFPPCSVHHWSRITYTPKRIESRRITQDQAQAATLADLYKLNDPAIDEKTLSLVRALERKTEGQSKPPREVIVNAVEVIGCKLFHGRTFRYDSSRFRSRLNLIDGGNGSGKSSSIAFLSPYPDTIGKLPECGRPSAIWEWFDGFGCIAKDVSLNGAIHIHSIGIKGQKVSCSIKIDGTEQLERGTFDEMKEKCESLYGSFIDYLLTSFYVQPQQGYRVDRKPAEAGLVNATRADMQRLVQAIAGIDHEDAHREALDNVNTTEKKLSEREAWLKGAEANTIDIDAISAELKKLVTSEAGNQNYLQAVIDTGKRLRTEYDALIEQQKGNNEEKRRKEADSKRYNEILKEIADINIKIDALEKLAQSVTSNRALLSQDDARILRMEERQAIINANNAKQNEYDKAKNAYDTRQLEIKRKNNEINNKFQSDLNYYTSKSKEYKSIIETFEHPCEHCGLIPYADAKKKIEHARMELAKLTEPVKLALVTSTEAEPIRKELDTIPALEQSVIDRTIVQKAIETGITAEATISGYEERYALLRAELDYLQATTYLVDDKLDESVLSKADELERKRTERDNIKTELAVIGTKINEYHKQIKDAETKTVEIQKAREDIKELSDTLGRWKYIASRIKAVSAMELELVADSIDQEATRILKPYRDGRYTFRTITQRMGKEAVIDEFDIMVHDNETGIEKSFLAHSVGEKAFLNDPYVKALIKIRNQRAHITYSPLIIDEADSAIDIPSIPVYYTMQDEYYKDETVIVISHTPDAKNYIQNIVEIKEMIC